MPLVITVEDGNNVAGANSYISSADLVAALGARGITAADDDDLKLKAIKAFGYIASIDRRFSGSRANRGQTGAFPRVNAYADETELTDTEIPVEIVTGQTQLVADQINGLTLAGYIADQTIVIEEQLGPIKQKRSEKVGLTTTPDLSYFEAAIEPLLRPSGLIGGLIVERA